MSTQDHVCLFPGCNAKYVNRRHLRRHERLKHSGTLPQFKCPQCPKSFATKWQLKRHANTVHAPVKLGKRPGSPLSSPDHHTPSIEPNQSASNETGIQPPPPKKPRNITFADSPQNMPPTDPLLPPTLEFLESQGYLPEWASAIHAEWSFVRTKYRKNKLTNTYQVRLQSANLDIIETREILRTIHSDQATVYKLQIGYTVLLHQQKTNTFRVYWPANLKQRFFPTPPTISNSQDLESCLQRLVSEDIEAHICQQFREDTSWKLVGVLAIVVTIYSLGIDYPMLGAQNTALEPPAYIKHHPWIKYLELSPNTGKPYGDKLCCFRSIAFYFRNKATVRVQRVAKQLMEKYRLQMQLPSNWDGSITLDDMFKVEKVLGCRLFIYQLVPKDNIIDLCNITELTWKQFRAMQIYSTGMKRKHAPNGDVFLNLCNQHLSPIISINHYAKTFLCAYCQKVFKSRQMVSKHQKICHKISSTRAVYKGGNFRIASNIFDLLEEANITLELDDKFNNYFAVWDTECLNVKMDPSDSKQPKNNCLQYESECWLVSVAVSSNIPSLNHPTFFRYRTSQSSLMAEVLDYFNLMAEAVTSLQQAKLKHLFNQLADKQKHYQEQMDCAQSADVAGFYKHQLKQINRLTDRLEKHTQKLVIFSFNGARFDIKLCRDLLIEQLFKGGEQTKPTSCIKRNGAYTLLSTEKLVFRDFAQLLPPGTSLDKFLKSQSVPVQKSFFPYDWMDSLEKLDQKHFPPKESFYNTLTNQHISEPDYQTALSIFQSSCSIMWDYLKDYNIKDVEGFVPAIEAMQRQWKQLGLCLINDGISLSALAYKLMHRTIKPKNSVIWLPRRQEKFVFDIVSKAIIGGPSICFTRFHRAGHTYIRDGPEKCQSIIGEDCNSLYLWAIAQEAPAGIPVNWELDPIQNTFIRKRLLPRYVSQGEIEFVLHKQHELKCNTNCCKHYLNAGQAYMGPRKWKPDFVCFKDKIIWLFNGCWIHCHPDPSCPQFGKPQNMEMVTKRRQEDRDAIEFYTQLGFTVNIKWQCEWEREKQQSPSVQRFLDERLTIPLSKTRSLSENKILAHIKSGKLFGLITLDVAVSKDDYAKFAHYPPFFVHRMMERHDLCPQMQEVADSLGLMKRPVKSLVSVMQQKQITITTPLLKWYLEHGIIAKNISQFIQFKPVKLFESFASEVTKHRKAADIDKDFEIIGTLWKNCGNSSYGKTLERRDTFVTTKFCDLPTASALVNSSEFVDAEPVSDYFEMTLQKKKYHETNAKTLGAFILAYGKLRMLQFVYDYLQKFWPDNTYELCGQDTDSCYYAISATSRTEFETLVKPELHQEFEIVKPTFIATEDTKREIGLFKLEWEGNGLIYLGPKSYVCFNEGADGSIENCTTSKFAAKGVSRKTNKLTMLDYLSVLNGEGPKSVENHGFMFKAPYLFKYKLTKRGLVDFYYKRRLNPNDAFKTMPLLELEN